MSGRTPFWVAEARFRAATLRFEGLPDHLETSDPARHDREQAAFLEAVDAVDATPVENWQEFAAAYRIACDDGLSLISEGTQAKLLADVRRLAGVH